ncbi:MAG: hypothetical protein K0R77_3309 [Chryseobacterium sp.]|jgi:serine/threonine protein kinase|uniref:protein kinase domain-containing protein n=1 Tax=Chryseobacterium sp. TaxID=1871047 RepID=UPI0026106403|nr:protein kinase [Chryseobacterium sp.]MDF2554034.1 hypothetical protein [Chryseobacterium sp.]
MKYILNNNIELISNEDGYFFLYRINTKFFKINKTIFDILELFINPSPVELVIDLFITKFNIEKNKKVTELLNSFIDDIINFNLIFSYDEGKEFIKFPKIDIADYIDKKLYIIDEKLYQSSKSIVVKLKDLRGDYCINKLLYKRDLTIDKEAIDYEYKILKSLQKFEFVPRLLNLENIDHGLYLECFDAENLKDKKIDNLTLESRLLIFGEILNIYQKFEEINFFHGDIHLKNILIDEYLNIKIIDFGESFYNDENTLKKNAANIYFTPPERIGDNIFKKFTTPSDRLGEVYQLSLILYYLYYLDFPFKGKTFLETRSEILSFRYSKYNDSIEELLTLGLNYIPQNRFKTISDFYEKFKKSI